jgi:hypothetical protein
MVFRFCELVFTHIFGHLVLQSMWQQECYVISNMKEISKIHSSMFETLWPIVRDFKSEGQSASS